MDAYKPSESFSQTPRRKAPPFKLMATVFLLVFGFAYYAVFVRAIAVTSYNDLDRYVGRNVSFVGEFNRDAKMYDIVRFDGNSVRFYHAVESINWREWSPKTGDVCRVSGLLEYEKNYPYGPPFAIRNAEYYQR